jgi:hypothetical protein
MKRAAVPAILVAVVLLAIGVIAEAQQAKKVPRIAYLGGVQLNSKKFGWMRFCKGYERWVISKVRTSS